MLQKMFHKPTKWKVMKELILKDTEDTVINSLGIISFVSFFIGGVITIQLALSTTGSFYPKYLVGYATRETIILECIYSLFILLLLIKNSIQIEPVTDYLPCLVDILFPVHYYTILLFLLYHQSLLQLYNTLT